MSTGRNAAEFTGLYFASGVYFYQFEVNDGKEYLITKKIHNCIKLNNIIL